MMNSHPEYIESDGIAVQVVRSRRRKTVALQIKKGRASIAVPLRLPRQRIEEVLRKKKGWIKNKIALQQQQLSQATRQYVSGEAFPYLGRHYRLSVISGPSQPVKLVRGKLVVSVSTGIDDSQAIRMSLIDWYRRQAELKLREKTANYAGIVGVEPNAVAIKNYKSRWGSCSSRGKIDFNWKLIMAPTPVVDYVVVHELCHLKQFNHSPAFWALVERVLPNYRDCKDWLKLNGASLTL